jgi:hypothetical protein
VRRPCSNRPPKLTPLSEAFAATFAAVYGGGFGCANYATQRPPTPPLVGSLVIAEREDVGKVVALATFSIFLQSLPCAAEGDPQSQATRTGVAAACEQHPASIGVATMLADGTIVYRLRGGCIGRPEDAEVVWKYPLGSAGYASAKDRVGGIKPGETKNVPPSPAVIGMATMSSDRTIHLHLWGKSEQGAVAEGVFDYKPDDPKYQQILQHLGGITPGQSKPVPPFESGK